jgi:hypothetical protein
MFDFVGRHPDLLVILIRSFSRRCDVKLLAFIVFNQC